MEYNERFSKLINPHYNSMLMTCREGNVVELIFLIAGIFDCRYNIYYYSEKQCDTC